MKSNILMFAEGATLAHVGRSIAICRLLDFTRYNVTFACDRRYDQFLDMGMEKVHIDSIDTQVFNKRLEQGLPVFSKRELIRAVQQDLALIDELKPEAILSDFRLSTAISARLRKIPLLAICNSYWSPFANRKLTIGTHPLTKVFGPNVAQTIFNMTLPIAVRLHAAPLNAAFKYFNLPGRVSDFGEIYGNGDYVLFPDVESVNPTPGRPSNHKYIGPCIWEPKVASPRWWNALPPTIPTVYVTFGSSGARGLLANVVNVLSQLNVNVIVATSGVSLGGGRMPDNVYVADYLPGTKAVERADIVVFNGGSGTAHQAGYYGKPMVAICQNTDQYLCAGDFEKLGIATVMRADVFKPDRLKQIVDQYLCSDAFQAKAQEYQPYFRAYDSSLILNQLLDDVTGNRRTDRVAS